MLSRLFDRSKALENKDPKVRLTFLRELSEEKAVALQARLVGLLQDEQVAEVRKAVFPHIRNVELLTPLLTAGDPLAREATEYIATRLQPDLALCERYPEIARTRLLITTSVEEQSVLLRFFNTPEQLVDLAMRSRGDLRALLLQHPSLNSEDAYGQIERQSRGHDKTLNRHARERIESIRDCDASLAQFRERSQTIADMVNNLRRFEAPSPAARETRRRQLVLLQQELLGLAERETQAVSAASGLGAKRKTTISSACFEGLDLSPPTRSPFSELLEALPPPESLLSGADDTGAADSALQAMQSGWQELASLATPTTDEVRMKARMEERYAALSAAVARMASAKWPELPNLPEAIPVSGTQEFWHQLDDLDRLFELHVRTERDLAWPEVLTVPVSLANAQRQRQQVEEVRNALREQEAMVLRDIAASLRETASVIEDGQSRQANGQLANIRRQIALISNARSEDARQQLDSLQQRVRELRDWQTFATSPKREQLLEQMRSLCGAVLSPEEIAKRIKQVRSDWNALGAPVNKYEHGLRTEFEHAADQAFEPCRAYFAEQDRQRQQNLQQRHDLVSMLRQYIAATEWQSADFKAAEAILHKAREEWHACFPLPRGDHKPMSAEFEALQQQLHNLVHSHYSTNSERKQAIIDRLKSMREAASINEQVEAVKAMQRDWKVIGTGLRHLEQKLWNEFRDICDAVFADRSKEADSFRLAQNTLLEQAVAQNTELARLIESFVPDTASPAILRDARSRFAELGDLGRDGRRAVDEHRQLLRQGEAKLVEIAKQRRGQRLSSIQELDVSLDLDPVIDIKQIDPIFTGRKPLGGDTEQALADITLLAEICAEIESPAIDRTRRMALQIELMNSRSQLPEAEMLLKRWCVIGDKPDTERVRSLRTRCFAALAVLLS